MIDQRGRPRAQRGVELGLPQQQLKVAAHAGIVVHAAAVEHQGCGRHEIGAEADRTDEPVFDSYQCGVLPRGRFGQSCGDARGPDRDRLA